MHRLLKRQLKHTLGEDFNLQSLDKKILELLNRIEEQYHLYDEEKRFLNNTIEVNSEELTQAYKTIENYNKSLIIEVDEKAILLEQYKNAIDSTLLVSKMDANYKLTYANTQFYTSSHYNPDELLNKEHIFLHENYMQKASYTTMHEVLLKKQTWKGTIETKNKQGQSYALALSVFPLLNVHNELIEYMIIGYDISTIVEARELAIASMEARTQFMANMSHEIRTPMNGITGFTNLLMKSELKEKEKQYVQFIQSSIQTLTQIVNDILDFSKIDSGNLVLDEIEANPFIEFRNITSLFNTKTRERNISYQVEIDTRISECIKIDILRVSQILSNLINNAVKFTNESGLVSVNISQKKKSSGHESILFSVKDTGIGIAKDKIDTIFQSFIQEDVSTTRKFGGTGLGLSISASLCKLMGSQLLVDSEKGKGSHFYFELYVQTCDTDNALATHIQNPPLFIINDRQTEAIFSAVIQQLNNFNISFKQLSLSELSTYANKGHTVITFDYTQYHILSTLCKDIIIIDQSSEAFALAKLKPSMRHIGFFENFPSILYNTILELNLIKPEVSDEERDTSKLKHLHILVAEDYDINRILIEELLSPYDITIVFAHDGQEAVEKSREHTFDMIFMDINMPNLNGVDATHIIRKTQKNIPIIALTANALEGDKEYYLSQGMSHYISKPIDPNILHNVLHLYSKNIQTIMTKDSVTPSIKDKDLDLDTILTSLKDAKDKMQFSSSIMKRLFETFIKSTYNSTQELAKSIKENNIIDIQAKAHAIRGGALSLHFEDLGEICRTLEYDEEIDYLSFYKQLQSQVNTLYEQNEEILQKIDTFED